MGKTFISMLCVVIAGLSCSFVLAQGRGAIGNNPKNVLDYVVEKADDDNIIGTELDKVNQVQGGFAPRFRLANTLDSVRVNSAIYLQWLSFAVLTAATALLIYNGLRLVFSPLQPDEIANTKKRILYIVLGLLIGTGFYFLIKIVLSVLLQVSQ